MLSLGKVNELSEKDLIEDTRPISELKALTFSNYKRSEVKKELMNALLGGRVENSCYWCAELICSGSLVDVWNIILSMTSEYVNVTNPKLPTYVESRYKLFRTYMGQLDAGGVGGELQARNEPKIRELFTELMCVLSVSKRRPKMPLVKLNLDTAFDMRSVSERLQAPNDKYAGKVFKPIDPRELFIPTNELAYHISKESRNCTSACYWIEWILQFEYNSTKADQLCKCSKRSMPPEIADKYGNDVGWLIWDVLKQEVKRRDAALLTKIVESLYFLYCFRYKTCVARRRRYMFSHVCYLLTEPIDVEQRIIENQKSLRLILSKCNTVYRQIKRHEVKDRMDYLKTII